MILIGITTETHRDDLDCIPVSRQKRDQIWKNFRLFVDRVPESHLYTLSIEYMAPTGRYVLGLRNGGIIGFMILRRVKPPIELTQPGEGKSVLLSGEPEYIFDSNALENKIIPGILQFREADKLYQAP